MYIYMYIDIIVCSRCRGVPMVAVWGSECPSSHHRYTLASTAIVDAGVYLWWLFGQRDAGVYLWWLYGAASVQAATIGTPWHLLQ